ncbi:MAG: PilZ domain-containing protein, partial [Verrucomicrobiota bacterium]
MAAEKSKYQLQERVGKNPYIEILRAKAIEGAFAGRQVTVERTLLEQPNYRHFLNAFISRAEIGRRLRHSNIIPVLEVSSLGDTACVVSDFVEGTSLARIIDRCRHRQIQLPVEFCCTLAWKIGQILSFAHGFPLSPNTPVGILHGELSPRHVLIVDSGEILLRGFGVSNGHVGAKLKSGIPNNAPNYLAPEQICGSPQTPATDVFALGALLYEALTTQTPFSGDGVEEVFDLILAGRLSPPTSARRGLPAAFDDLIGRACSPSIEGRGEPPTNEDRSLFRYRNAIEFCDALSETWGNELLDPQAISAEVRGLFGTTGATRRERRYPVILSVLFRSEDASVKTQTEDLSLSGAFVRIVSPPPLGAFVGLKIFGFGEEVQTDAEVVWTRPGDGREGCGLRFVRRVPEDQIRRLVGKVKQQLVEAYVRTQADKDGGAGSAGDTPQIRGEANTQTQQLQGQKSPATTRSATGTMPAAEPASEAFSVPSFSEGSARASRESLEKLIRAAASHGASDIHIHVGHPAILRIGGELVASKGPPYTPQKAEEELLSLINAEQREELLGHGQIEFAHDMPDALRARVTYCRQHRGGVDGVFRIIPGAIPSLSELNLPASLAQYVTFRYGLVLITGPAGSGKSTTL